MIGNLDWFEFGPEAYQEFGQPEGALGVAYWAKALIRGDLCDRADIGIGKRRSRHLAEESASRTYCTLARKSLCLNRKIATKI